MISFEQIIKNLDPEADYTLSEAAEKIGVSYSCILAHISKGNLNARKVFNRWYVNGKELRNYLTEPKKRV